MRHWMWSAGWRDEQAKPRIDRSPYYCCTVVCWPMGEHYERPRAVVLVEAARKNGNADLFELG